MLISYAAEFEEPYASDASIAIGLLAVALGLLEGGRSFARMAALAVAGAVAVWCSHPATFVLGGIGSALLLRALVARDRRNFVYRGADSRVLARELRGVLLHLPEATRREPAAHRLLGR